MKITFETNGGFAYIPNLNKPVVIDTAQIDPQAAKQLESCVRESLFFDQPAKVGTIPEGSADYQTYTITVQDGNRVHTTQLNDPIGNPNLERLLSLLEEISRRSKP